VPCLESGGWLSSDSKPAGSPGLDSSSFKHELSAHSRRPAADYVSHNPSSRADPPPLTLQLGGPPCLASLGFTPSDIGPAVEALLSLPVNNPVPLEPDALQALLMVGAPPPGQSLCRIAG
jgi:hypothetical protein